LNPLTFPPKADPPLAEILPLLKEGEEGGGGVNKKNKSIEAGSMK